MVISNLERIWGVEWRFKMRKKSKDLNFSGFKYLQVGFKMNFRILNISKPKYDFRDDFFVPCL